ncbi:MULTISPECIES: sensor histidine kinase [Oceanicaulis]|uniref:sensor histidine kinase n=1 Tax=Oceanicaulis TaxID=153232 RepID=UPI0003B682B9|nr:MULTISPECIES: stimulus-sensing domain-containing protein [Oceanicaulis]VXC93533.1 Sensor protein ChvG [Oceanicaulis sp. 350]
MASATVIRRLKVARRAVLRLSAQLKPLLLSRLGATIILTNLVALSVVIGGMFAITENRRGLVDAKVDSLSAQAEIIANIITETAVYGDAPGPEMDRDAAREVLRRLSGLYVPDETRALLHAPGPVRIADSDLIAGDVDQIELPPLDGRPDTPLTALQNASRSLMEQIGQMFLSSEDRTALDRTLADEVREAFQTGEAQSGVRRDPDGGRVVSVTIPIQLIQAVVGTVTYESYDLDALIAQERAAILPYVLVAASVSLVMALVLTVQIAWPVRRLAEAAREVRLAGGRRVPLPDMKGRRDEIGDMGRAFTQMTNALYDRLDAIEAFAADVSHEIKNPLTSIRSASEILPLAKDDAKRARLIDVIQHDVKRLDRLITDISNASRLDAELAREDLETIDLAVLLNDLASLQNDPDAKAPRVTVSHTADRHWVRGHEHPLSRVFINLIENAITFSPADSVVKITIERGPGQTHQVRVEDNGPGIPEDNREAIFDRFYTQRPKGAAFGAHSGLGLAIARQIVTAHGGQIEASNRLDDQGVVLGACFTVTLPAYIR